MGDRYPDRADAVRCWPGFDLMKPTNRFYVGGPPLDPPDEPEDGELTAEERRQKAFDDFDPPDDYPGD